MRYQFTCIKTHIFPLIMTKVIVFLSLNCNQLQNWHYSVNSYGLKELYTDVRSKILGIPCVSRLKFIRATDEKGKPEEAFLSMEFTVSPYSKMAFNFKEFEGPHALAGGRKLMSVTLTGKDRKTVYWLPQAGWISAEMKDGFTFGTSASVNDKNSTMRKIIHDILAGAENIEISVKGIRDDAVISSIFSIGKGRDYFKNFMIVTHHPTQTFPKADLFETAR